VNINLINDIGKALDYKRTDLIEKDLILQQLLSDLSSNQLFSKNFAFKGGTCLIKAYTGYFRFSEDIDFTYLHQKKLTGISKKKVSATLSKLETEIADVFVGIAAKRGFDFKNQKGNREYMEFGGSNRFVTYKIWYDSAVLKRRTFIKVQINFVEEMCFKTTRKRLKTLVIDSKKDIGLLYPEYKEYIKPLHFVVYDKREIAAEKVRAILTRRGIKARDFFDLYMLHKKFKMEPKDVEKEAVRKIKFAANMYDKYRANMTEKAKSGITLNDTKSEDEMLLENINNEDFYAFKKKLEAYSNRLLQKFTGWA
jgi:predicted nucleotidyltransferase component of viral defense system